MCPTLGLFGHIQINKKKGEKHNIHQVFKDQLATKFPWVENVMGCERKLQIVHCKMCIVVEGKEKLLNLKLYGLKKHYGKQKF